MSFIIVPCVIGAFICHLTQAAVTLTPTLPLPEECEHDGKVYPVGGPYLIGCWARCWCSQWEDDFYMGCVSMCPPMYAPGCHEVYRATRNETTSTDCCPEYECPPDCVKNEVTITFGYTLQIGNEMCTCGEVGLQCNPLPTITQYAP